MRARSSEDLAHSQAGSHQTFGHDEDRNYEDSDKKKDGDDICSEMMMMMMIMRTDDDDVNLAMIHSMISSS